MTNLRVYFFCCNEPGNLQEDVIALAEGLKELGVPYFANCDYWLQSLDPGDYLFKHCPEVSYEDCDIVVVSYTWPQWVRMGTFELRQQPLPANLFRKPRHYITVYMDNNDGYRTISFEPEYRQFDLILRSKFNTRTWHPENMQPWAYGLTNRIIEATRFGLPFRDRRPALLVNFGVSHPFQYATRKLSRCRLEPKLERILQIDRTTDDLSLEPSDPYEALMWRQTGGRFSRSYYGRLTQTQAVACFCGDIIPCLPFRGADRYLVGGNRAKFRKILYSILSWLSAGTPRAVGCDSFRFWEALSAGAAAINVDLGLYGVQLPLMPENGAHYIGVDFERVDTAIDQLVDTVFRERVADAGRRWAHRYFSPRATAERFLQMCCEIL
jgi:hypothetical protein